VLVALKMASWSRAQYLEVDDPLPAGFDVIDESPSDLYPKGYSRDYISRVFVRDQRMQFYQDAAEPRIYLYLYMLRATTPGKYAVNPATIKLSYYPDVHGTSSLTELEVTP